MKRVLSAILVLTMVLSALTAAAVVSAEGAGREGEVTVFLRDFENGEKASGDGGNIVDVKVDFNGNHFASVMMKAETIMSAPTGDENRVTSLYENRANISNSIPYISGKTYSISWKLGRVTENKITPVASATSGIESMSGGALLAYGYSNGVWTPAPQTQWYNTGLKIANGSMESAKASQVNDENGWRVNTYSNIAYKLCKSKEDATPLANGAAANIKGLFFSMSGVSDDIVNLLVDNMAYCGKGLFKQGSNGKEALTNSFTLDAEHVYGDEACIKNGTYTAETLVGTKWELGKDCTGLKSATRTAKFKEALAAFSTFHYAIDDVKVTAKAMFYDNTVTAGENGKITVTTTSGLGDADNTPTVVSNETKAIEVNDYYGTTYEVTSDDGYAVNTVTYGGEEVSLTDGKYTVAPSDVADGKEFKATFYRLPGIRVRSFRAELKGGTTGDTITINGGKYGKYITSTDGMLTVTTPNSNIGKLNNTNAEEGYFEWISARDSTQVKNEQGKVTETARMYAFLPKTKMGSGRKIQLSFDMSNGGTSNFNMPYSQLTKIATSYYADGAVYGTDSCPWAAVGTAAAQHHKYGPGAQLNGSIPAGGTLEVVTPVYDIIKFAKSYANETEYSDKVYQKLVQFDFVVPGCADTVTPRLHAVTFTETTPVYEITAAQNDQAGSVKLYSESLNFGVDNDSVEIGNGTVCEVEHMMTAGFNIKAPENKVIEKVEFIDAKGVATDYSAQAANEAAAEISMTNVAASGTLNVTYKEQAATEPTVSAGDFSAVTDSFTYTPADGGEAVTVTGKTSIITYAKIDNGTSSISECGYYISKLNNDGSVSGSEIKLKAIAVPEGLTYGIRAFGDALTAGNYSVQPYIVKEGGTEIRGDAKTLTINSASE